MSEHQQARVSNRIGEAIRTFCESRLEFHADDMRSYIATVVGPVAPGSPDRILRELRQRGLVNYVVVSRRDSLYRIVRAGEQMALL
jgi:hypothetical protein